MSWQDIAALAIVAMAAGGLLWRRLRRKGGHACGGCSGCAADATGSDRTAPAGDRNFVSIESLTRDPSAD